MGELKLEESWYRISIQYDTFAVFAIVACQGRVVDAAKIARWTIGKRLDDVLRYYRRKGAKVELF